MQVIARGVSALAAASTVVAMLVGSSKPLGVDLRDVPGPSLVRSCAGVLRVGGGAPALGACVSARIVVDRCLHARQRKCAQHNVQ